MCDAWLPDALKELVKSKLICWGGRNYYASSTFDITEDICVLIVVLMFAQLFCVLKYPRISGDAAHLISRG